MHKTNRFLGSALLVAGTSIGAGMLAIPTVTGFAGFVPSLFLLVFFWLFMLCTSFLFLEVNISIPGRSNLVTMARKTLGPWGQVVAWSAYLMLLYSLTAAYISASAPIFLEALSKILHINCPEWIGPLPLLLIFGAIIYHGTKAVDYINRALMTGLIVSYIFLVMFVPFHVHIDYLKHIDLPPMLLAFSVLILSFGFHIIIPSLTTYERHNKRKLQWTLAAGSFLPLVVYIFWDFLALGAIPLENLSQTWQSGGSGGQALLAVLKSPYLAIGTQFFSFFAIITSFIGVSLSLSDFLIDGLKIKSTGSGRIYSMIMTFLPPLGFVYFYPRGFLVALQYGGIFVAILLCILPALMAWQLPKPSFYHTRKGRALLIFVIVVALLVIAVTLLEKLGYLQQLVAGYV